MRFQTKIVCNSETCLSKENMLVWWIEKMTPSSSVWLGRCRGDCFYSWTSCVCGLWQHQSILPQDFVRQSSVGVCQEQRKIGICPSCTSSDQLVGTIFLRQFFRCYVLKLTEENEENHLSRRINRWSMCPRRRRILSWTSCLVHVDTLSCVKTPTKETREI